MKWILAAFLSIVFAVLSFNAFIGNDLSQAMSGNKIIAMLTAVYTWLVGVIGTVPTGVVFALCALGVIAAAIMDGRDKVKVR